MTEKEVITLIKQAAKEEATRLDLSSKGLKSLPAEIGKLTNLTELILGGNQLSELPAEIGQLAKLTELNLGDNQLSTLPAEIWQLTNLTGLYLHYNQLSSLPAEIGQLKNLTALALTHNQLSSLPAEIGQLKKLRELGLGGNQLSSLPVEIGQLKNLMTLYLSDNQLSKLPAEIGQLTNLTVLHLFNNQLSSLPAEIEKITNLWSFCIDGNPLTSVPEWVKKLKGEIYEAIKGTCRNTFTEYHEQVRVFSQATNIAMSLPEEYDSKEIVPLWLKFEGTPQVNDVSTAISTLDNLAALIRVFHRESKEIPAYAAVLAAGLSWQEKERQEEESRLVRVFEDPVSAINPNERLAIYRAIEGSLYLGLGRLPKWLLEKLAKLWDIIPEWRRARAEAELMEAQAEKVRAEAEKINQETETIGPKSEVEIQQEWEKLRKMEQDRVLKGLKCRIELIGEVLKMAPPECRKLSPRVVMTILNQLMSTMDDGSKADHLGRILTEEEIKRLPQIETQEIETDDPEEV